MPSDPSSQQPAAPLSPRESDSQPHFAHLRLHTEFSIRDGLVSVNPMVKRLTELEYGAVAITDLNNLFGLIKFYSAALNSGVKPLCGCDVPIRSDKSDTVSPVVLLAMNKHGYKNLTRLISAMYTEGNPGGELELAQAKLAGHSDGLIAISGGQFGDVGAALLNGDTELARSLLDDWLELFPGRFYLEVQRVGRSDEEDYIDAVLALAADASVPVVATNDVRFLQPDDFEAHEVRVCINERRMLDDPRRPRHYTDQQYLKSREEMAALFDDMPEALENAWEIVRRCNLVLELGKPALPDYPTPEGQAVDDYLVEVSREGLLARLKMLFPDSWEDRELHERYWQRLDRELGIINEMEFAGYFLIVMEFIQWAKDNGIPVGPGRGSGAGSIVAYALKITDLDPLRYDLLFERFLNPERVSMPDFDVDFCMDGRDRVIQHVSELYGKEAVSQIITFGTMAAKAVVRDVARVQGKPFALADKLSKLIPFEPGITLSKAFEDEPLLGEFVDNDEDAQEIMEMAYKLEGITRNVGKHAGGVVIAPTRLTDFTPLYADESGEGLVTQFDKNDVETAGLVKFDFLGLRTLTIIDWAVKMIAADHQGEAPVDINNLPLDDRGVYELMQRGETTAVFQLESRGMKELIKRLRPSSFEDIIALVALFRPGPLQSGMVDDFIDRKHGKTEVQYPHPDLEPVLGNTYGVILYQEQVMQIAQVLANYTLGGADILRKAMGKKKPEEMAKQRTLFVEGAAARGVDGALAESIFDLMEKFAGYGFNKSHSAAYALVSYQTAWLKVHYPAHFMAAVLSADMQNTDKVVTLIEECRAMGLSILPPSVNEGRYNFTVNGDGHIVYGLGAIKGLGEGPVAALIKARENVPFESLLDLCSRVDSQSLNRRSMEAMIKAGALDTLMEGDCDTVRAALTQLLPDAVRAAEQRSRNQASGVADLFGEIAPEEPATESDSLGGKQLQPWAEQQRLRFEKDVLGLYLSGHPINEYLGELALVTRNRLSHLRPERGTQIVAGLLHGIRTMKNKAGDTIAFLTLDDRSAHFEVSLFAKEYDRYRDMLQLDQILLVECSVSVDDYTEKMRGRAKHLMSLEDARGQFVQLLRLRLDAQQLSVGFSERLAQLLEPHRASQGAVAAVSASHGGPAAAQSVTMASTPGRTCPVQIELKRPDCCGCIMLDSQWSVQPAEPLLHQLRREFGRECVELRYQRPDTLEQKNAGNQQQ